MAVGRIREERGAAELQLHGLLFVIPGNEAGAMDLAELGAARDGVVDGWKGAEPAARHGRSRQPPGSTWMRLAP